MGDILIKIVNKLDHLKDKKTFNFAHQAARNLGITKLFKYYKKKKSGIKFKAHIENTSIMFIDNSETFAYYYSYLNAGAYEPALTKKIKELLQDNNNSIFFDIGAHLGYYSILTGNWTEPSNIYAIEPNPSFFNSMSKNLKLNNLDKRINTFQVAFSDKKGVASMGGKNNRVMKENLNGMIDVVTFDQFCKERKLNPDIIKIDVHGAEGKVIAGMPNVLKNVSHIFCETHSDLMGYSLSSIVEMLRNAGLQVFEFTEHRKNEGGQIIPLNENTFLDHRDRVIYGHRGT